MVNISRANSDYTVYQEASLYIADCNKCGGSRIGPNASKSTVQQAVVTALTGDGGSMYLKAMTIDSGVLSSLPSNVLAIEDYQGKRTYYRNGKKLFELQDLVDLVVGLP